MLRKTVQRLVPAPLLGELVLLVDERSLAYPTSEGNWQVVKLPTLRPGRRLPTITEGAELLYGHHHGSRTHYEMLKRLYTYEGFVEVEEGDDVVVDVGAYIGTFTRYAARRAGTVIAIDPIAAIDGSLARNVSDLDNVVTVAKAAWNGPDEIRMSESDTPARTSALPTPYDTESTGEFHVDADTVPNLVRDEGFEAIDFLKIEGEGVEPEILEGTLEDDMPVERIAVDAGPEREGEPITEEVSETLRAHGYECRTKEGEAWWGDNIVFARK